MIRLLRFLVTGDWHLHRWETIHSVDCSDEYGSRWTRYNCKCEICGEHKTFEGRP